MQHHSRLVVDEGHGHSHAHVFRVGSTRVCVCPVCVFMAQFASPQPQFDNSSDTASSFPQASSKPCLPATLTPTAEGLVPAVQSGALAPLRSSYLKHLVESGEALQKRQDLPEAAFWDVAAFKRLTELEDCPSRPFSPCRTAGSRRSIPTRTASTCPRSLPCWRCTRRLPSMWGTNVDDCAVFWDFGSLFQPERTPRSEGVVPRGSAGEQRVVRQFLHDGPDPAAPSSRVHRHAVQSKRVVFRGSDDQFRHQDELLRGSTREPWSWTVPGT